MAPMIVAQAEGIETAPVTVEEPIEFESVGGDHALPEGALQQEIQVANESSTEIFPPFDASTFPSQILWLLITFAALYFVMKRIALPRISDILEERRDRIEGDLAEAERLRQKTDQAIASYEAALAEARSNAHAIAEASRTESKAKLDAARAKVEANLALKVTTSEERIAATKAEALGHVDEIATETAQAVVAQLIGNVSDKAARDAVAKVSKE